MSSPWITPDKPALVLAPMEGVTDAPMRAFLTERGGFSFCVSEFLRISQDLLPARVYLEHVPELRSGCVTPSGTPIQFQLLGGNEELLAMSAARACEVGAKAIDLNFGCPAPTVNRHDGGATLLKYPQRIRAIVSSVRKAVPAAIPVSAKLRLGWENMDDIFTNAQHAAEGGASWLTIHARTKTQGYAPPAHWKFIGEVRKRLDIPVVANGEIWNLDDFRKCRDETGCQHFMIGRGALGDPSLPQKIAREIGLLSSDQFDLFNEDARNWEPVLKRFSVISAGINPESEYTSRRIKQWLRYAHMKKPLPWYRDITRTQSLNELFAVLVSSQPKA